jgi:GGDEF domain-containing protein
MTPWDAISSEGPPAGPDGPRAELPAGLRDRRALFADLDGVFSPDGPHVVLAIFALDGLGAYRELYGRPAAQTLLARLAARLVSTLAQTGTCYQPREDEFVALIDTRSADAELVLSGSVAALHQRDSLATVSATFGAVLLPDDANDAAEAVRLADEQLSANSPLRVPRRGHAASAAYAGA